MTGEYDLKPLHDLLYRIYEVIADICVRHGLRFYTSGGTTLGAVRHRGFIPWDDDLDLSMPRPDLEKFRRIVQDELPPWLKYLSWRNRPCYTNLFSKIIVSDETILNEVVCKSGIPAPGGVSVDIFPIDGYPSSRALICLRVLLMGFCKWYLHVFHSTRAYGLMEWFSAKFDFETSHRVIDWAGWVKQERKFATQPPTLWMTPKTYGQGRDVPFENKTIRVPDIPEEYLRQIYGDWTALPPEDKRHPDHTCSNCRVEEWRLG